MRLMRHRLSPRATTLVEPLVALCVVPILGAESLSSDGDAAAIIRRGGATAVSRGLTTGAAGGGPVSARAVTEPVLRSASLTVTATPCFDSATVPSASLALSVNS